MIRRDHPPLPVRFFVLTFMTPQTLTKWIIIVGGLLAAVASAVYVGVLVLVPVPAVGPDLEQQRRQLEESRLPLRPRPAENFVGSLACRECHADEFDKYQGHPMAKSAGWMHEVPVIEDYAEGKAAIPVAAGRVFSAERKGTEVTHHETFKDAEGLVYDVAVPIHLEVGSGKRGRSYITNRDGVMLMSPLTWYSTSSTWGLSPGFTPQSNPRFSRRIVDGCIQCHVGSVHQNKAKVDQLRPPYFAEVTIGCERCHGPGEGHIAFHRGGGGAQAIGDTDPIVNPVKLEPARREAVCNQCHLQGVERVPQYHRSEYDFRPGNLLSDVWVTFVSGTRLDVHGTEAVSQVEQMEASKCYQMSDGRMGCLSCHDAHSIPAPSARISFYRERCLQCHSDCALPADAPARLDADNSCIACHMPTIATNNVPHTAATDHRIMRIPDRSSAAEADPEAIRVYQEAGHEVLAVEINRARGIRLARLAQRQQDPRKADECLDLLAPIIAANPDDIDSLFAVGGAYWVHGQLREAERFWDRILMQNPDHEPALANLAIICHEAGAFEEALTYLDVLIEVNPHRPELYGRRAHILGRLGRLPEGVESAKKVLEMDPGLAQMHGWLAEVYELMDKKELAQQHRLMHLRMTNKP